ncbi:MAG: molecular chaperone DnaK, partial [Acidobacteriaceae bacterium]|nr:molecular chaperone DnaK [Acidobacteriaceae bacterium]
GGLDQINSATDKLTTASHKLAEAMYKSQSAGAGAPGQEGGSGTGAAAGSNGATGDQAKSNVVDAEFVDVEDKK